MFTFLGLGRDLDAICASTVCYNGIYVYVCISVVPTGVVTHGESESHPGEEHFSLKGAGKLWTYFSASGISYLYMGQRSK